MTLDQFRDMASEGLVVECQTVQERRNVLELFDEAGIKISDTTQRHLWVTAERDSDTTYMHPGTDPGERNVTCYRDFERAKRDIEWAIPYSDVQDLIENPTPLDDRSDAEFASDFASLLCRKEFL